MTHAILLAIVTIFAYGAVGVLARRLTYIRGADLNAWSRFVIDFFLPGLIFHAIVTNPEMRSLNEIWLLPATGFGMVVLGAAAGGMFKLNRRRYSLDTIRTFHHFCATNNFGYLPIIIVQNVWGTAALADLFLINLGSTVGYWSIGVSLPGERRIGTVPLALGLLLS